MPYAASTGVACAGAPRARRALWAVAAAAIVLGIIGMHALTLHAMGGSHSQAPSHSATAGHAPAAESSPAAPSAAVPTADERPGHAMGEMMMLCAAMLAAAAGGCLLLLLLRRVPRTSWWLARPRAASWLPRLTPVPGATGPPDVWAFSVIRC